VDLLGHVCLDQREPLVLEQVREIGGSAGETVVQRDGLVPLLEQPSAQVRAQEPAAPVATVLDTADPLLALGPGL